MFGVVAALGVALFEYRLGFLADSYPAVLVPYVSVVIASAFFGAVFSGWFFKETGLFELLVTPIIVISCAAFSAGQLYTYLTPLLFNNPTAPFISRFLGGIYASAMYLYASSPIVVPSAAIASYALWRQYRLT